MKLKELFENTKYEPTDLSDYSMDHRPPGPEDGAPLFDLTGGGNIYPDDVYSSKAAQYYGTGEDHLDRQSFMIAQGYKGKPNASVVIYRALPNNLTVEDRIKTLVKHKKYILAKGKLPPDADTHLSRSDYYGQITDELDELEQLPPSEFKLTINSGDWVTINRDYAVDHGMSALKGKYKIIRKTVKAKEIFTNGDSIHEWGYWANTKLKEDNLSEFSSNIPLGGFGTAKYGQEGEF
jgi:hypothetical protein